MRAGRGVWLCAMALSCVEAGAGAGVNELFAAIETGDAAKVAAMVREDRLLAGARKDATLLPVVAAINSPAAVEVTRVLLDAGADANATDRSGHSLLMLACRGTNDALVRLLIERKADVNARDRSGDSPVVVAVSPHYSNRDIAALAATASVLMGAPHAEPPGLYKKMDEPGPEMSAWRKQAASALEIWSGTRRKWLDDAALWTARERILDALLAAGADIRTTNGAPGILVYTAMSAPTGIVARLIAAGADVNAVRDGRTALLMAAMFGNTAVADLLIDNGADIEKPEKSTGYTPLMAAAQQGLVDLVKHLVEKGADVNASDIMGTTPSGKTPLLAAMEGKHYATALYLLDKGASAGRTNMKGHSPLNSAAMAGNVDLVRELLKRGASPMVYDQEGFTPLLSACECGSLECVKLLEEAGGSLGSRTSSGITAMLLASSSGNENLVRYLLDRGLSPAERAGYGDYQTPLLRACASGFPKIARMLLDAGAGIYSNTNDHRLVPLMAAAAMLNLDQKKHPDGLGFTDIFGTADDYLGVVKLLIERGADVKIRVRSGDSAIHFAAMAGNVDIVRLLLDHGLDVAMKDDEGKTPLHFAAIRGHLPVVKFLLEHGADPRVVATGANGETPLHDAAVLGHVDVVRELLVRGASPDARDASGTTALFLTATVNDRRYRTSPVLKAAPMTQWIIMGASNNLLVAEELIRGGADINAVVKTGGDALLKAVESADCPLVRLLLHHGAKPDAAHLVVTGAGARQERLGAIHIAAQMPDDCMLRALLAHGADPAGEGYVGTALHAVAVRGPVTNIDVLVRARPALLEAVDRRGRTPLTVAVIERNYDGARRLLALGADPLRAGADAPNAYAAAREVNDERMTGLIKTEMDARLTRSTPRPVTPGTEGGGP